jgi:3-keto-5-aminohexanoate cleavage enzyme
VNAVLTIAPTGPIATKADNPALPTSPEEIADAVAEACQAGAAVAHIHLRHPEQRPTADLGIARQVMNMITDRCDVLVQMSTGVGLDVPFEEREKLVELRPRMEIYDTGHLEACLRLRDQGLLDEPLQFSIVLGVRGGMAATADNLVLTVRKLPAGAIWQVIAIGRANLELTAIGLALGGNARAGLEDTLHVRKGELAPGNRPLVARAAQLARDLDRGVASVEEAEAVLQLPRP